MRYLALALLTGSFILFSGGVASADNATIGAVSFDCVGVTCAQTTDHTDTAPFKGSIDITLNNTGTEAWGDFHMYIFQAGSELIDNVHFDTTTDPTSSTQTGLSWAIDNDVVGATIDLYFYGDPVLPGNSAQFTIFTDNTIDQVSFFGVGYYPTPVPEPGTALLLGMGVAGLAGFRRRSLARRA